MIKDLKENYKEREELLNKKITYNLLIFKIRLMRDNNCLSFLLIIFLK